MKNVLVGIKIKFFYILILFIIFILNCYTPSIKKIPEYNYNKLMNLHFQNNKTDPFPIIVEPFEEEDFSISEDGYMVYSSNVGGNYDLWLRDLKTILKIKIIEHPAKQFSPYIKKMSRDQYILLYISDDSDINGDIYLTYLNPQQLIEAYIEKRRQVNLWDYSLNVSKIIEDAYKNVPGCIGKYKEVFPFISFDNKFLYFVTNRCLQKFYLWKIPLKKGLPSGKPEIVIEQELYYPSVNNEIVTFTVLKNNQFTSNIGILNLQSGEVKFIIPKNINLILEGINILPQYSLKNNLIYFINISKDTNGNQRLDPNDNGVLLSVDLNGNLISQILPENYYLKDFKITDYLNGSIFYSARFYKQQDIFLTTLDGNIPKKNDPFEQYALINNYDDESYKILVLQSIFTYFNKHPEFYLLEGEIFYELINRLEKSPEKEKLKYFKNYYEIRIKENPYINIFYQIRNFELNKNYNINKLQTLENQFLSIKNHEQSTIDYFYFKMGELSWSINQIQASKYFLRISKTFKKYSYVAYYLLLYDLRNHQYQLNKIDIENLKLVLKNEELIGIIYNEILNHLEKLNTEILKSYLLNVNDNILKNLIYYSIARKLYSSNQMQESLNVLNQVQGIESYELKYLNLRILKLKINIYKKLGLEKELFDARNQFINTYDKKINIELDEEEIQELIMSSNFYVDKYRKSAQYIYKSIEQVFSQQINLTSSQNVPISILDRDNINDFCAPDSVAGKLIDEYNYLEYEIRYAKLCENLEPYKNKTEIPMNLAFELNQLMYLSSYAYANLINILFINLHQKEIFKNYHRRWSIYYHRLKVELAVERFNYLLDWQEKEALFITKEKIANILIEKDPFVGTIFNDLLYGYREIASKMALESFEYSVLYGHAYTLIRKTVEREKFYDDLFLKGYKISNSELLRRKENLLLELKEAEYQLLYILLLEPENEDAALLLSYLYAYIDSKKEQQILNPPGYIDQLFRFLTKREPKKLTDGIFYRALYKSTFPERLYEKNIDILENTLSLRKLKNLNISSEIYLNLGNNYFRVFNYNKAIENYKKIEAKDELFDTLLQKVLFYFNYAKANIYNDDYEKAKEIFLKSYDIFYKIYQNKLVEFNKIKIQVQKNQSETAKALISVNLKSNPYLEKLEQELKTYKLNLIVIQIYISLSNFYIKNYKLAIDSLNHAIDELNHFDEVKKYNLLNFKALNYLNDLDYINAIQIAKLALEEASSIGLKRNDNVFLPQTVGGRFLGLFMNFGEDFMIIGDGRIANEISSLRSYEISLGIIENSYRELGDIKELLDTIERKKQILMNKDFDTRLGKESYISLINQEATIYYILKQYEKSYQLYDEASKISYNNNFVKDYYINFKNKFYVRFDEIENYIIYNSNSTNEIYRDKIQKLNNILRDFKNEYYIIRTKEFIEIRRTENPDYKLNEIDKQKLLDQIQKELKDFFNIQAILKYYDGIINKNSLTLKESIDLYKDILSKAESYEEIDRFYFRVYLNYIKAKIQYNNLLKNYNYNDLIKEIQEIYPQFLNYHLTIEFFEINSIIGDLYYYQNDCSSAIQNYEQTLNFLEKNLYFITDLKKIESLNKKYIECLWQKKRYREIVVLKEKFRFIVLHHLFFSSKLKFADDKLTKFIREIQTDILELRNLKNTIIKLRFQNKNVNNLIKQLENLDLNIQKKIKNLENFLPEFKDYLTFNFNNIFINNDRNQFIYLVGNSNKKCINIYKNNIIAKEYIDIKECIIHDIKNIVLIPDRYNYENEIKRSYNELLSQNKIVVIRSTILDKSPAYINNIQDLSRYREFNLFNHKIDTIVEEQDIKTFYLLPVEYLLNLSKDGIGQYFYQKPTFSQVNIKSDKKFSFFNFQNDRLQSVTLFDSLWISYDYFYHLGISTLNDDGIRWGIYSYDENVFSQFKKDLADKYFKKGLQYFKNYPDKALNYFSLSNSIDESFKTKNYIMGALIRINHPKADKFQIQLLDEIKNKKIEKLQYYVMLIRSLMYKQEYKKIITLMSELEKQYKDFDRITKIKNAAFILNELSKSTPDYIKIESIINSNDYDTSFTDFIIDGLHKHGFYYLSLNLSNKYKDLYEYSIKNQIDLYLLNRINYDIKSLKITSIIDTDIRIAYNILTNQIQDNINLIRNENNQDSLSIKDRLMFYRLLKEHNIDGINNIEEWICGKDFNCNELSEIEKKLMVLQFINFIPYDQYEITKENLKILINNFFQESCFKGNIYLTKVISKYVENSDYNSAFDFYNRFKSSYNCIWNKEGENYIEEIAYPLIILRALNYKIDDKLILNFFDKNKNLNLVIGDFIKFLVEPKEKLNQLLVDFHWKILPEKFHFHAYDVLMQRFLKEKDYKTFQNIALLKDEKSRNYINYFESINKNLKNQEEWINLIDFNSNFYQCTISSNTCTKTNFNSLELSRLLNRYFIERQYYKNQTVYEEELLDYYSKLISIDNKINYLWINDIHKYAPIVYQKNLYFIFSPLNFKFSRQKNPFYNNNKIITYNYNSTRDITQNLFLVAEFKNQFLSNPYNNVYVTLNEIENQYNVYNANIHYIEKEQLLQPLNFKLTYPKNSYGIFILSNYPIHVVKFVQFFYTYNNIPMEVRFNNIYKTFLKENQKTIYFSKPYVSFLIED